jgi:hypothetical protein
MGASRLGKKKEKVCLTCQDQKRNQEVSRRLLHSSQLRGGDGTVLEKGGKRERVQEVQQVRKQKRKLKLLNDGRERGRRWNRVQSKTDKKQSLYHKRGACADGHPHLI